MSNSPRIFSSETVIGAALMKLGIAYHAFATADHAADWLQGSVHENLNRRFGPLLASAKSGKKVVVVVDSKHRQYVVSHLDELERVWRKDQIAYTLVLTHEAFESIRGDIAITAVPALEPA